MKIEIETEGARHSVKVDGVSVEKCRRFSIDLRACEQAYCVIEYGPKLPDQSSWPADDEIDATTFASKCREFMVVRPHGWRRAFFRALCWTLARLPIKLSTASRIANVFRERGWHER